jgi:predicted MFS family arabinose efflux permease
LRFEFVRGPRAMMPLHLFASKSFVGLTLFTLLLYGALGGLLVLLPYVLISAAGYSATGAGAALLPMPLILTVTSPVTGALAGRIGARAPLTIGPLVVAVGFLLALRINSSASYWTQVLPMIVLIALGMSAAVAPLTTAVLTSVDSVHTGSASGLNSAVARTGGLIATALLGSVLAAEGAQLLVAYHVAMVIGALICAAASLSALTLLEGKRQVHSDSPSGKK